MDIDSLTKKQVILLVLLVSFVTSLVTGIVTVSLMNQAPLPITQTVHKVIEKITPGESQSAVITQILPPQNEPVSCDDIIVKAVDNVSSAVVSVIASKDIPIIEQYFVNPFKEDEFFKNLPQGFLPDVQIPQYRQKGTESKQVSSGTGFFVSKDGLLLTNKHVVEDTAATYSIIMNDGRKFGVRVLARDPFQDIAILKVDLSDEEQGKTVFNFISLGDSNNLRVGQSVIAIGNALGEFRNTVSVGIISGLNRSVTASGSISGPETLNELIQTDAAINPGNSGGPLVNTLGRVIGINTAMATAGENVGFALPINIAKRDINDAVEFGEIKYPYLGIRYKIVEKGLLLAKGPEGQSAVEADGPAAKAGLKEGDTIIEIDGVKIDNQNNLSYLLSKRRIGDKIKVRVLRGEKEMFVEATLAERPKGL